MDQYSRPQNEEKHSASDNNNVISLQACKVSKEHKQASKLQNLGTRISYNTHQRFKKFVLDKHGKLNGPFALEVENALEFWISNQQHTTFCGLSSLHESGRPRSDKIERFRRIAMQLKQLKSFPYVNHFTLIHQINSVLGNCDKRTFNKYLSAIKKLSKEQITPFAVRPELDISRFVEKIQSDDW